MAQTAPSLGSAEQSAVLGATTVTNVGLTIVNGDLGLTPGASVTGFPPGTVINGAININNVAATSAKTSAQSAYTDLASRACDVVLGTADLAGRTLTPGVHCSGSSMLLSGVLTLDAQNNPAAVFIFQIGSTLTVGAGASVVIVNGAASTSCNTSWQVGSSATLGTTSVFTGNILAFTSITLNTGATLNGRALALNGAVTLDTNTVDSSGPCGSVPGAPTGVSGTPGNEQVSVSFTPPASNGGSAITGYTVTASPDGATATGAASPIVVTGLTNGTAYTFTVTATNAVGTSAPSAASNSVTPSTTPGAPAITGITAGDTQLSVAFTAGTTGGSALTNYEYSIDDGANFVTRAPASTASPLVITGLTNGTTYTVRLRAVNANGTGTASDASTGTPSATTFSVASATGTGTITIGITGPAGCTISSASGITAEAAAGAGPDGVDLPHGLVDLTITGCTPGATVDFTVTFPSPLAADSEYWKYGPTSGNPSPHWYVLSSASISGATVTYSITDGGAGDDDLAANGTIEDPAGPGATATPVPTVPGIVLAALTLLLIGAGSLMLRRRILVPQASP